MQTKSDHQNKLLDVEVYDDLQISQVQALHPSLSGGEVIYFTGKVQKHNSKKGFQERILMITSTSICNIQPKGGILTKVLYKVLPNFSVKRKIQINDVDSLTVSKTSDQLIINQKQGYDYFINAKDSKNKIIKSIANAYFQTHTGPLVLFLRDESDLQFFNTTKKDFKINKIRRPYQERVEMTAGNIKTVIDNITKGQLSKPLKDFVPCKYPEKEAGNERFREINSSNNNAIKIDWNAVSSGTQSNQASQQQDSSNFMEESERWKQIPMFQSETVPQKERFVQNRLDERKK